MQEPIKQKDLKIGWQLVDNDAAFAAMVADLSTYPGAVALDTERASGYRYNQKAYLVQIRRTDSPIYLIDPLEISDFQPLAELINSCEWILHAGSNDLAQLAHLGLYPGRIWDTQIAAALLGQARLGLGAVTLELLGVELEKAYSNGDWSTRPLPVAWLEYAAYDVAFLQNIYEAQQKLMIAQHKQSIIAEEMALLIGAKDIPLVRDHESWQLKLSGVGKLSRNRQGLNIAGALWKEREKLAEKLDIPAYKIIADQVIIKVAQQPPRSIIDLKRVSGFKGRHIKNHTQAFWRAVLKAKASDADLRSKPPQKISSIELERLKLLKQAGRNAIAEVSKKERIAPEQLLSPAVFKQAVNTYKIGMLPAELSSVLTLSGARKWQVDLLAVTLSQAFADAVHGKNTATNGKIGIVI